MPPGAANATDESSDGSASAASRISGVWNAPPTLSGVTRFTPSSLARAPAASTPSGVPAITTCPGALSLATQHASGAAVHASDACSGVAPSSAAIFPGWASAACCVSSAAARREADAGVEGERAGCDQRGHLTERVAGEGHRCVDVLTNRLPGDERGEEDRELRLAGSSQGLRRCIQEQRCERLTERVLRALDDDPGRVVAPGSTHAR